MTPVDEEPHSSIEVQQQQESTTTSTTTRYEIPSFLDILLQSEFRILHHEPPLQINETKADRDLIQLLLNHFWDPQESRALLNAHDEETGKEFTYGEVTTTGTRQLMEDLELLVEAESSNSEEEEKEVIFYDLGSGEGKATVQVLLETLSSTTSTCRERVNVQQVVGVELSPARHAMAVQSWGKLQNFLVSDAKIEDILLTTPSITTTPDMEEKNHVDLPELDKALNKLREKFHSSLKKKKNNNNNNNNDKPRIQFINGNLLDVDYSNATHIFASSIFFPLETLESLSLQCNQYATNNKLKRIAALSDLEVLEQSDASSGTCPWEKRVQRLQMSWGGANVRIYTYKDY